MSTTARSSAAAPTFANPAHGAAALAAYHPLAIRTLHWLTLVILAVGFGTALMVDVPDSDAGRALVLAIHRYLGLSVWLLALARLTVRSRLTLVRTAPFPPRWQQLAANAMHAVLYLLLVGLPLLGMALTNARGQPVLLPGGVHLPAWPARDLDLADTLESVHGAMAWTLAGLAAAHATVALWHHHIRRDQVLIAMLLRRRQG